MWSKILLGRIIWLCAEAPAWDGYYGIMGCELAFTMSPCWHISSQGSGDALRVLPCIFFLDYWIDSKYRGFLSFGVVIFMTAGKTAAKLSGGF